MNQSIEYDSVRSSRDDYYLYTETYYLLNIKKCIKSGGRANLQRRRLCAESTEVNQPRGQNLRLK